MCVRGTHLILMPKVIILLLFTPYHQNCFKPTLNAMSGTLPEKSCLKYFLECNECPVHVCQGHSSDFNTKSNYFIVVISYVQHGYQV
jgi:hypothetical protein